MASEYREQTLKDVESLSLEKYIDEVAGAVVEGLARCKTEKDVWSAVEVLTDFHDSSSFGLLKNFRLFQLCTAVFRIHSPSRWWQIYLQLLVLHLEPR
jgi:hypothetical protein